MRKFFIAFAIIVLLGAFGIASTGHAEFHNNNGDLTILELPSVH